METPQKATCLASESLIGTEHTSTFLGAAHAVDRIAAAAENALPSLEFRGVVVENGTVLRHWRQELLVKGLANLTRAMRKDQVYFCPHEIYFQPPRSLSSIKQRFWKSVFPTG